MISVTAATQLIQSHVRQWPVTSVALDNAVGRFLAQRVYADRDLPPYPRVMMDGIAISCQTLLQGQRTFPIAHVHAAGAPPCRLDLPTHCVEVMTGASLPAGTDTVIRYEDLLLEAGKATVLNNAVVKPGQSVHRQGADARQGDALLQPGICLSPAEIAVLASVGKTHVDVYQFPTTTLVSTGNELVPVSATPSANQIRSSNVEALAAALVPFAITAERRHVPDDRDRLQEELALAIASSDLIILTGGVSKGKFDYVPEVLTGLGVECHFHQVAQRPGKPLWFGTRRDGKVVFALPGNPVSTFMCFLRYIRPWLLQGAGVMSSVHGAVLGKEMKFEPPLTLFLQVKIRQERGIAFAIPVPGGGSGDFANLREADGFLELDAQRDTFHEGDVLPFHSFRNS